MTTSKKVRLINIHKCTLGSRERAEIEAVTIKCAESYQPITNEWSLWSRRCTEHYFVETIFAENNAVVVVVLQKQQGRDSITIHIASHRSRQDRLLTS